MCACIPSFITVSNPYSTEQIAAVAVLVFVFSLWAAMKPAAIMVIRVPVMLAALVALCGVTASAFGLLHDPRPLCKLTLQATVLLSTGLVAEMVGAWLRVPRARAGSR